MSRRLIIRPEAEADLREAYAWYEEQRPGLGDEFLRAVDDCLAAIRRYPMMHPLVHREARRALARRFLRRLLSPWPRRYRCHRGLPLEQRPQAVAGPP